MTKTITVDGVSYTLATITAKVAKNYVFTNTDGTKLSVHEMNSRLIAASLEAGCVENVAEVLGNIPYFLDRGWSTVLDVALEVNGMKAKQPGKPEAEASPAVI
jgi:hypothetical protein